jgi:hypothetical protein
VRLVRNGIAVVGQAFPRVRERGAGRGRALRDRRDAGRWRN